MRFTVIIEFILQNFAKNTGWKITFKYSEYFKKILLLYVNGVMKTQLFQIRTLKH